MMKQFTYLLLMAALSISAGCATYRFEGIGFNPNYERGQGQARVLDAPFAKVWGAVPEAMTLLGFDRVYPVRSIWKPNEGSVRAFRPITAWSGTPGRSVMVFVDRLGEDRTRVEVISKTPIGTQWIYREWAPDVMQKIEQVLLQGTSGTGTDPIFPMQERPPFPIAIQQSRRLP